VPVPLDLAGLERDGLRAAGAAFDEIHRHLFTFALDAEHEIVNLRAIVRGPAASVLPGRVERGDISIGGAHRRHRRVGGRRMDSEDSRPRTAACRQPRGGARIVTEMDSTTLILPNYAGEVDLFGNILVRPVTR
jgi:N-methylhydantoinase A